MSKNLMLKCLLARLRSHWRVYVAIDGCVQFIDGDGIDAINDVDQQQREYEGDGILPRDQTTDKDRKKRNKLKGPIVKSVSKYHSVR